MRLKRDSNYIILEKIVKEKIPLLRVPTADELYMIENNEVFSTHELLDFDNAEKKFVSEDYSFGEIQVVVDDVQVLFKPSEI